MAARPRIEGFDDDVVAQVEQLEFARASFNDLVGIELDLLSRDRIEAHVDVTDDLTQPYGLVHGGVYTTLVETLGSIAGALRVLPDGDAVVGVSNSTDFLRSTRDGRIEAVCTPVHVGRTQHLWLTVCSDGEGRLLARGQLRVQVLDGSRVGA